MSEPARAVLPEPSTTGEPTRAAAAAQQGRGAAGERAVALLPMTMGMAETLMKRAPTGTIAR